MKKLLSIFFGFLLSLLLGAEDLVLLQTTDIHGESGIRSYRPGLPRMASVIQERRNKAGKDNVILIDGGDLIQGSFSVSLDRGKTMVEALNETGYDVWVPGNHDFDYGPEVLKERMRSFRGTVLAANLEMDGASGLFRKWKLFEKAGKRIAVIGCVPPYLSQWIAPAQRKGVQTLPPEEAIAAVMPEIEAAKPDLVVLAIHLGQFSSSRLNANGKKSSLSTITSRFPRIRIVLGGHTHEEVPFARLYPESVYVQSGALGEKVAEVTVRFPEKRGEDLTISSQLIPADKQAEDPGVKAVFKDLSDRVEQFRKEPVAHVPMALGPDKKSEPLLAGILAESMRKATGADLAFSAILSNFQAHPGMIYEKEIFLLAPYENFITILTLTEDQLKAVLAEQEKLPDRYRKLYPAGLNAYKGGTVRAAFGSYAASGSGGRYPVLRDLAKAVPGEELQLTVRDVFRAYLKTNWPPKK